MRNIYDKTHIWIFLSTLSVFWMPQITQQEFAFLREGSRKSGRKTIPQNRFSSRCFLSSVIIMQLWLIMTNKKPIMTNRKVAPDGNYVTDTIKKGGPIFFRHSSWLCPSNMCSKNRSLNSTVVPSIWHDYVL